MKFLLINGSKAFGHSQGRYNATLHDCAKATLSELGHELTETIIDAGYEIPAELDKWEAADVVIHQLPAWWMGEPWIVKEYIDKVFTQGHGRLYDSDGRSRSDSTKKYGSGGLLSGKQVMLSVTWNAPEEAFTDPAQFFEGQGLAGVFMHFYKAHEFLGMRSLPIFSCHDVMKQPNIEADLARYRAHLSAQFKR